MERPRPALNALLAGFGSAFALFPSGQLDAYLVRQPTQARMAASFERVGQLLSDAMAKEAREQEAARQVAPK